MLPAGSLVEAKILAEELRSRADGQEFSRAFKCFGLKEISLQTERKHQNLAQMLFRVSKTNVEGVSNDPKIRGGVRQAFHLQHLL